MSNLPDPNDKILDGAYAEPDIKKNRAAAAVIRRHFGNNVEAAVEVLQALELLEVS